MDADDIVTALAPAHLLAGLNGTQNDVISSYHRRNDLTVTAIHVSLALTGNIGAGGQGKDRHTGPVLGNHASGVPCLSQDYDKLCFHVESGFHGG